MIIKLLILLVVSFGLAFFVSMYFMMAHRSNSSTTIENFRTRNCWASHRNEVVHEDSASTNAASNDILHISNLDDRCLRCLCKAATKCNLTLGCEQGYCGPFKVSRVYWKDAGSPILPDDDIERAGAFEDCALSYHCAIKMVKGYIAKFGRDCNGDGITNCHDYSMINFNGGYQCHPALDRNDPGKAWLERFESCI